MLTDQEFRVWTQYLLSADDFGVMRWSTAQLKADNDHFEHRPVKVLQRSLDALARCGLVHTFEHQGKSYAYQSDWQTWQKVEYPRATNNPVPDAAALALCDEATRALYEKHPGGTRKQKTLLEHPECIPNVSQDNHEDNPTTRAGAPAKRLTANGVRLTANGSEGSLRETLPLDRAFQQFAAAYPAQGRCASHLAMTAFVDVLSVGDTLDPRREFTALMARLEGHKRSHQWRVKTMIPRLDRYLREGLHLQELPVHPPTTDSGRGLRPAVSAAEASTGWECPHLERCANRGMCDQARILGRPVRSDAVPS